jgi:hypothetical protein
MQAFFVKTTRNLDFFVLHVEINFTKRIYTQNNIASLPFRSDELDFFLISRKWKGVFAKPLGRVMIDKRPSFYREAWGEAQRAVTFNQADAKPVFLF